MWFKSAVAFLHLFLLCSVSSGKHFGYSAKLQNEWHQESTSCSGHHQSPIHLNTQKAIPLSIPALELIGFHNLLPRPVSITNNGHSVEVKSTVGKYGKVFGALLNGIFDVEAIHFHWGRQNNRGSEHVLNNIRFPMEMHLVTRNTKYDTLQEALPHKDGLAVLAFFFNLRERSNTALQSILSEIEMIQPDGSTEYLSQSFTLASLLPKDMEIFYTYRGSLTTPPCSEAVTWIIFPDPIPISFLQMNKFRYLSSGNTAMSDNYRHLQPIGTRKIFVRRKPSEFQIHRNILRNYTSDEFWEHMRNVEETSIEENNEDAEKLQ